VLKKISFKKNKQILLILCGLTVVLFCYQWAFKSETKETNLELKKFRSIFSKGEYDFLDNEEKYTSYVFSIPGPSREEVLKYLEKNNYSSEAILAAISALSTRDKFEINLVYDGLKRHPHNSDLWTILLCYEKDHEKLHEYLKNNPPSPENAYITQIWLLNEKFAKTELKSLVSDFNELSKTKLNLNTNLVKVRQAAYKMYLDLGYKDYTAKLKAIHPNNNLSPDPLHHGAFLWDLSHKLRDCVNLYSEGNSNLTKEEFSQIFYAQFLIRNSSYQINNKLNHTALMIRECDDLKKLDPTLEYGNSEITVGDRLKQIVEKIDTDSSSFENTLSLKEKFFKQHLYNGNVELHKKMADLNLNYHGQELEDQIMKLISEYE
jgi:hypothetical protein